MIYILLVEFTRSIKKRFPGNYSTFRVKENLRTSQGLAQKCTHFSGTPFKIQGIFKTV